MITAVQANAAKVKLDLLSAAGPLPPPSTPLTCVAPTLCSLWISCAAQAAYSRNANGVPIDFCDFEPLESAICILLDTLQFA